MWDGLPGVKDSAAERVAMLLQWLSSPVAWTMIVLIVSGLGIYRELF